MVPLIVNGVQAKLLDEARSGILSGVSAKAGLPAEAAMAAPAIRPAHFAVGLRGLMAGFNVKNEIIFFLSAGRLRSPLLQADRPARFSQSLPAVNQGSTFKYHQWN